MEYTWWIFSLNIPDETLLKNPEKNSCWSMSLPTTNMAPVLDVMGKNWLYVLSKKNKHEKNASSIIHTFYLSKSILFIQNTTTKLLLCIYFVLGAQLLSNYCVFFLNRLNNKNLMVSYKYFNTKKNHLFIWMLLPKFHQ